MVIKLERLTSLLGMAVIIGFCTLISQDRKGISWRLVAWGVGLQFALALLILKSAPGLKVFQVAEKIFAKLYDFTSIGVEFLTDKPLSEMNTALSIGAVLVFVASLMAVLYYLRVIQAFVYLFSKLMQYTMRISGAEALASAFFVFMGIETVTAIKRYLREMTRSELFTVMTAFMATIAGSVMVIYVGVFGAEAGHILAASIMSAPAAILLSKILVPETEEPKTGAKIDWSEMRPEESSVIEAAANGAEDGMKLALTIVAMLLAFVALIGMLDFFLGMAGTSFRELSGFVFAPVAWLTGVPWEDCLQVGRLLGIKVIFNEFISYQEMQKMALAGTLSPRSFTIATYALCSFANFGSLAILIGGIGGLAPERRSEVARFGLRALLAGFLAGLMTAAVAGILVQ
jgi:CNT family concentrative nucleoside transporter